jgi:hypothetical protein
MAVAGCDDSDEEQEDFICDWESHEGENEDDGDDDPEDIEDAHTRQARLQDAYWEELLQRATARDQQPLEGMEEDDRLAEEELTAVREGSGLWEIGCWVCIHNFVYFRYSQAF